MVEPGSLTMAVESKLLPVAPGSAATVCADFVNCGTAASAPIYCTRMRSDSVSSAMVFPLLGSV